MLIVEYRVPMPLSAQEYRIGQLYTIAKKSKLESTDAKKGFVRIDANEAYTNGYGGSGQYTNKTYYLANRLPDWIKRLMPESAAKLKEEAWNAYPSSRNKFTNPILEKLTLEIESRYLDGPPTEANVFNLDEELQKLRSIVVIDLATTKYKANKTGVVCSGASSNSDDHLSSRVSDTEVLRFNPLFREPLTRDWLQEYELAYEEQEERVSANESAEGTQDEGSSSSRNSSSVASPGGGLGDTSRHLMTCYKLCRINFPVWPLQNKVEQFIQQYCRDTIIESHRQTWLWQDEWTGMDIQSIRLMERETQLVIADMIRRTSVVGN